VHGLWSGSDSGQVVVQGFYWFTGGSVLFLTAYRILVSGAKRQATSRKGEPSTLQAAE
ncbi:hypothetical protein EKD04_023435, partial [Chloroflexales bacterium ZM16-3]|nr:hypothetical protein [Chloroflexales bacterium ZM16-3]